MSAQPDHRHYVRRVVLPSGKTIEVVYFEDQVSAHRPVETPHRDLHVCATCASELVYPVEWQEAGPAHWRVVLRCPNCEWTGAGVYEQAAVEVFDEELDRGTEALLRDLRRLVQANMEERVERFIDALRDDHIVPDDF